MARRSARTRRPGWSTCPVRSTWTPAMTGWPGVACGAVDLAETQTPWAGTRWSRTTGGRGGTQGARTGARRCRHKYGYHRSVRGIA
jgi:hypothetical protein